MEKNYKPFDLEAAKAGAPVVTRDGRPARIICWDYNLCGVQKLLVLVKDDVVDHENILAYNLDGTCCVSPSPYDLFMAPVKHEGWVNLYRDSSGVLFATLIQDTKEKALSSVDAQSVCYVATAKIEWEE